MQKATVSNLPPNPGPDGQGRQDHNVVSLAATLRGAGRGPMPGRAARIAPPPLVPYAGWQKASNRLGAALLARDARLLVVGPAGTGKSLLLDNAARILRAANWTVLIRQADISGLPQTAPGDYVVMVDEADRIGAESLSRLLDHAPYPIVLAGLDVLATRLPKVTTIRLPALGREKARDFIAQWLALNGRTPDNLETAGMRRLVELSGGVPRLLSTLLGSASWLAQTAGETVVTQSHVEEAAALRLSLGLNEAGSAEAEPEARRAGGARAFRVSAAIPAVCGIALLGLGAFVVARSYPEQVGAAATRAGTAFAGLQSSIRGSLESVLQPGTAPVPAPAPDATLRPEGAPAAESAPRAFAQATPAVPPEPVAAPPPKPAPAREVEPGQDSMEQVIAPKASPGDAALAPTPTEPAPLTPPPTATAPAIIAPSSPPGAASGEHAQVEPPTVADAKPASEPKVAPVPSPPDAPSSALLATPKPAERSPAPAAPASSPTAAEPTPSAPTPAAATPPVSPEPASEKSVQTTSAPQAAPPADAAQDTTPPVVVAMASPPARIAPLSAVTVELLLRRGRDMLALGDVSAARLLFGRAADAGDGKAMLEIGRSYDPTVLARANLLTQGDSVEAAAWYRRAQRAGEPGAAALLDALDPARH